MPKVMLASWCDRWKHGNLGDKDFFSIRTGEMKDTSEEMIALAMGRLVMIDDDQTRETGRR
jgi:hypothetical protein